MYIKNDFERKKIHSDRFCIDCEPETAAKPDLGTNSALRSSSDTVIISVTLRTWIGIAYLLAGSLLLHLYIKELTALVLDLAGILSLTHTPIYTFQTVPVFEEGYCYGTM